MIISKTTPQHPHTVLIHPYDFTPDGKHVGWQTMQRLSAFERIVRLRSHNISAVVLTAGYPPDLLIRPPGQTMTFANMMRKWILDKNIIPPKCIHVSDDSSVWTSKGEITETIRMITALELPKNVLSISTWNHVYPRLFLTWKILIANRPDWNVRFAYTTDCRVSTIHELFGTMYYVAWAMRQRLRQTAIE